MEEGKKHKVMIGIEVVLLCMIIAIVGTNAASSNPPSNGVSYSKNSQTTVEGALNDLYNKANYGNANAKHILKDKTALVEGIEITGTMPNRGAISKTISSGGTYIIPSGYHSGSGKVTCKSVTPSVSTLGLGDYIRYTPSNMSFSDELAGQGWIQYPKLNPSEMNLWRVIRKNSNGTVDIVSEYVSSATIYFDDSLGYNIYIEKLNEIAKSYEDTTYTIGSRHMGYDTSNEKYKTDVELVEIFLGTLNAKKIGGEENASYWLAKKMGPIGDVCAVDSRCANGWCKQSLVSWGSLSVRPIVVLKSTLKLTGGNGTASSPYTLGV